MKAKVIYLHGIGGATDQWVWVDALNHALVECGFDVLMPEDVIDFDYSALLGGDSAGDAAVPAVTLRPADCGESWQSEYILQQESIRSWVANSQFADSTWTPAVPDGLGHLGHLLLSQVKSYTSSTEVRHAIWNRVIEGLVGVDEVVIVGHSLGSVIAADVIPRLPEGTTVRCLVTVASPLRWSLLRKWSKDLAGVEEFPFRRVRQWVNVFEPRDVVAFHSGIASHYPMALDIDISTGPLPGKNHDVGLYAAHPVVAYAVGSSLWGSGLPAAIEDLPDRRLDPSFRYPLLKFAYAENLNTVIPDQHGERRRRLRLARALKAREAAQWAQGLGLDPSLVPLEGDFLHHPTARLKGTLTIDEILPQVIQLASEPVLPPFSLENKWDPTTKVAALDRLLLRLDLPGARTEVKYAEVCIRRLDEARGVMKVQSGAGTWKWVALGGAGLAAIAVAVASLGTAAPAGVAGAAAVTSALAAIGPGGMVGGVATIAAITGAGAVAAGGGVVGGVTSKAQKRQREDEQMRENLRSAVAEMVVNGEPEQLRMTAAAYIATVTTQEELGMTSSRDEVRRTLLHVQAIVRARLGNAKLIDPKGRWTATLETKSAILDLALGWFEQQDTERDEMEEALKTDDTRFSSWRRKRSFPGAEEMREAGPAAASASPSPSMRDTARRLGRPEPDHLEETFEYRSYLCHAYSLGTLGSDHLGSDGDYDDFGYYDAHLAELVGADIDTVFSAQHVVGVFGDQKWAFADPATGHRGDDLEARLFHDRDLDVYYLVNRPTKTKADMVNNIITAAGAGIPDKFQQAAQLLELVRPEFRDKIVLTGLSLGGALSAYAAVEAPWPVRTIIFDPLGLNRKMMGARGLGFFGQGEVLSHRLRSLDSHVDWYYIANSWVADLNVNRHLSSVGKVTELPQDPVRAKNNKDTHDFRHVRYGLHRLWDEGAYRQ